MITNIKLIFRRLMIIFYSHILIKFKKDKLNKFMNDINIMSIEQTADLLSSSAKSIARFGDGEFSWLQGKKNNINDFQNVSKDLSKRLKEVLYSNDDGIIIAIPQQVKSLTGLTSSPKNFWTMYNLKNMKNLNRYIDKNKVYANTSVTRPYIDFNTDKIAKYTFKKIKSVWDDKNVLIIEGRDSRLGYHNDLFSNAKDIRRIECPSTNAFDFYDEILNSALEFLYNHKEYISLIALGPTATVLSYDLFKNGYRAIDIGHVDVEYEWYLMGAKERINLQYKYVNEVSDGHNSSPINDEFFNNQIIDVIKQKN